MNVSNYIVVNRAFQLANQGRASSSGLHTLNCVTTKDGRYVVSEGTRDVFPELFTGSEPVISLNADLDFADIQMQEDADPRFLILSENQEAYAEAIAKELARLGEGGAGRTRPWCGWLKHTDGRVALHLPSFDLGVEPTATGDALVEVLKPIVTANEKAKLKNDIAANQNKAVKVADFLPASVVANMKTQADLLADGWTL